MLQENCFNYEPIYLVGNYNRLNINENNLFSKVEQTEPYTIVSEGYLDIIRHNEMEINNVKFKFSDYKWDFSSEKLDRKENNQYKYDFTKVIMKSDYYATLLKLFMLNELLTLNIHYTKINLEYCVLREFVLYLIDNNCNEIEHLNTNLVSSFINSKDLKERTNCKHKGYIKNLLQFYEDSTNFHFSKDIHNYLNYKNLSLLKAECRNNKRKLLPQKFMSKLTDILYENTKNIRLDNEVRAINGLLFIGTQTGLRAKELTLIKPDCVITKKVNDTEIKKLQYTTTKSCHGGNTITGITICNTKCAEIIATLHDMFPKACDYLTGQYISYKKLDNTLKSICRSNAEELNIISKKPDKQFERSFKLDDGTYINIPIITQFRVFFASELIARGIHEIEVAKLLNHKDEKMLNYYARPVLPIEQTPQYKNLHAKVLKDKEIKLPTITLTNIVKANNMNEVEELVNEFTPLKCVPGGVCAKFNPLNPCIQASKIDEEFIEYASKSKANLERAKAQLKQCIAFNEKNDYERVVLEEKKKLNKLKRIKEV